jgi:Flp pilus assembly protein TadB
MSQTVIHVGAHDRKRGTGMKLFDRHDTPARQSHPRRNHAILFAVAVVVLALAWLGFNALISIVTLD